MIQIMVLGSGCKNCHTVAERAQAAVRELNIQANVELNTDMTTLMRYGVMQTPAIVINDKLVSTGRVPAISQIKTMVESATRSEG